ncbi:MAG: hypothetical protein OEV93_01760 [Candidatus Moranbacteria bacterium]|nr:hypothetical protein [Candidatus Moranbacteria bacterium]
MLKIIKTKKAFVAICAVFLFLNFNYSDAQKEVLLAEVVNIIQVDEPGADISEDVHMPTNLGARVVSPTKIMLEWDDNTKIEDGYAIERKENGGSFVKIGQVEKDFEDYIDSGAEYNKEYTYRVVAFQGSRNSKYSNEANASILVAVSEKEEVSQKEELSVLVAIQEGEALELIQEESAEFFQENEEASTVVAVAGVATGAVAVATATFFPLFSLLPQPFQSSVWSFILIPLYKRRIKDAWGIVFDAQTKVPVVGAVVKLVNKRGLVVDRVVTDKQGRYGFLISNDDEYTIAIDKGEYSVLSGFTHDKLYGKIYDGKAFNVNKDEIIRFNIAIKIHDFDWDDFSEKFYKKYNSAPSLAKKYFLNSVALIGLIFSVGVLYFNPSILNYIIMALYVIIFIVQVTYKVKKPYGHVVGLESKKPLPFAMISLLNANNDQRESFTVSDVAGRYYLLAQDGEYKLKINARKEGGKYLSREMMEKIKNGILKKDYEL